MHLLAPCRPRHIHFNIRGPNAQAKFGLEEPIHCRLRVPPRPPGRAFCRDHHVLTRTRSHTSGRISSHLEHSQPLMNAIVLYNFEFDLATGARILPTFRTLFPCEKSTHSPKPVRITVSLRSTLTFRLEISQVHKRSC